jgi:cell division protein FtsI (penicillin-binding protein 3)
LRARTLALAAHVLMCLGFVLLVARLFGIQVLSHAEYSAKARRQVLTVDRSPGLRGQIYDRWGELLAASTTASRLMAHPSRLGRGTDLDEGLAGTRAAWQLITRELAPLVSVDPEVLEERLTLDPRCVTLVKGVDPSVADAIREWIVREGIQGLRFDGDEIRTYPHGSLGAHVVGFVGYSNEGLSGLEHRYDDLLSGQPGRVPYERDAGGRLIHAFLGEGEPPRRGADLRLTLDLAIQSGLEDALDDIVREHSPEGLAGIVLDPRTGAVLALANRPTFDCSTPFSSGKEARGNRCLTHPYEPGSTIKPFVVSVALESGEARMTDEVDCGPGWAVFGSRTVRDVKPHRLLDVSQILVRSSNVGMSRLAQRVGCPRMRAGLHRMGLGDRMGIDLGGESRGLLRNLCDWRDNWTLVSVSFGYELTVTPLQIATLYGAIANDGVRMTPYLVEEVISPGSRSSEPPRKSRHVVEGQRIMEESTAIALRGVLRRVVAEAGGTGRRADVPGFEVAGKSGTAQRYRNGVKDGYNASFVGFAPWSSPEVVVVIVAYGVHGEHYYGGTIIAPAVRKTLECVRARLEMIHGKAILDPSDLHDGDRGTDRSPVFARAD